MITLDVRRSLNYASFAVILIKEQSRLQDCQGPMVQAQAATALRAVFLQAVHQAAAAQAALGVAPQAAAVQAATGRQHISQVQFIKPSP